MNFWQWLLTIAAAITVLLGALTGLGKAGSWVSGRLKKIDRFLEEWNGDEARPGWPERPGVMKRLADLEQEVKTMKDELAKVSHEVKPNGGGSMRDSINRMESHLNTTEVVKV